MSARCTPWLQVWEEQVVPETLVTSCLMRQTYLSRALTATPRESKELTVTKAGAALLKGAAHKFVFAWQLPAADLHTLKSATVLYSPSHYYAGQARDHMYLGLRNTHRPVNHNALSRHTRYVWTFRGEVPKSGPSNLRTTTV
jgi:hypothetical protein